MAVNVTMYIQSDDEILYIEPVELLFDNQKVWKRSARAVAKEMDDRMVGEARPSGKRLSNGTSSESSLNTSDATLVSSQSGSASTVSLLPATATVSDNSKLTSPIIPAEAYKGPANRVSRVCCAQKKAPEAKNNSHGRPADRAPRLSAPKKFATRK